MGNPTTFRHTPKTSPCKSVVDLLSFPVESCVNSYVKDLSHVTFISWVSLNRYPYTLCLSNESQKRGYFYNDSVSRSYFIFIICDDRVSINVLDTYFLVF